MSLVLDASVTLAWCFEDEQTPAVMDLLDRIAETGGVAPLRGPSKPSTGSSPRSAGAGSPRRRAQRWPHSCAQLPITLDGDTAERVWDATARLASQFKLSVYDAAYLELAQRRRLPLASLDQDLRTAAKASGIDVLGVASE